MVKQRLGVNVDHIATLRQARREGYPDPVEAALRCCEYGADSIIMHLREDRRHICDEDVYRLKKVIKKPFNLEMSINKGIVDIACDVAPDQVTLVPEKRQEITTEGGLDVLGQFKKLQCVVKQLHQQGIVVSLFVAPDAKQIQASADLGVDAIEIHTGVYANATKKSLMQKEAKLIKTMSQFGSSLGLKVFAGHGLNYENVIPIAAIEEQEELNIGHSIISYAVFVGLKKAVKDMKNLMKQARK